MNNVVLQQMSGKITHFVNADFKVLDDLVVVEQMYPDEIFGGINKITKVFDKDDVKYVRFEK